MAESTVTADSKLTSSDTRRRIWAIVGPIQVIWSSGSILCYSFCTLCLPHFLSLGTQLDYRTGRYFAAQELLMRPIGGWLFGRIADKHGRKKSMLLSSYDVFSDRWLSPALQVMKL